MARASRSDDPLLVLAQVYARVFDTDDGRLVLDDLRLRFGDRQSFVAESPHATSYHEGQRAVYLLLCRQLEYAHDPVRRQLTVVGAPDEDEVA